MFCPNCGARVADGRGFCGACGRALRGAGAPQMTSATNAPPAVATSVAARPVARKRHSWRRRAPLVAAAAVAATVAIVITGLLTERFGLARPHLTPGVYILSGSSASDTTVLSISEGDHVSLSVRGSGKGGWDARVSQAGRDHLHVQVPITAASLPEMLGVNNKFGPVSNSLKSITALRLGDGQSSDHSLNLVIPRGAPDSIVGTWAWWVTDKSGLPQQGDTFTRGVTFALEWMKVEDDGTFRTGTIPSSDMAAVADSLKAGTFQGDNFFAFSGKWIRQGDGSFVLTSPDGHTLTFQYHK